MENTGTLEVAAAILISGDRVLIARRKAGGPQAGLWEFPGGKLQAGETPQQGLQREIREELAVEIEVGEFFCESLHCDGPRTLRLRAYRARLARGTPAALEHDAIAWASAAELAHYEFSPADRPFVARLQRELWTSAGR